ncbi:MAG: peptidase [Rhizobiaceae bacterium]
MKTRTMTFGLLGLFCATLAACTVTVDEQGPPPRAGGYCPRIYQPVCATRYGERQTISNACVADQRGFDILYRGECRSRPPLTPRPPRPPRAEPYPDPGVGVACPLISAPVCARRGRVLRTFANDCVAEASGFQIIADGDCGDIPNAGGG